MVTIISFIVILAILVLVHEWGHFWTARKMGMKVNEFGIGFPPRAWSKKVKDTLISINWLPLGGFVRIKGEDGSSREDEDSFAAKKPWQRIVVLSAGVIMNFLLAGVLLAFGFMIGLPQALNGLGDEGNIRDVKIQIISVLDGAPAKEAGLKLGDQILSFAGEPVTDIGALIDTADTHIGEEVDVTVRRGDEEITKEIEVTRLESTGRGGIGVGLIETGVVSYAPHVAIYKGFEATTILTGQIVNGFYNIIKNLIAGRGPGVELSGPVGVAVMTGQVAQLGLVYLLQFAAVLSINLAVINFLPFPALDGGRVVFVLIEKLRGKPVNDKIEGVFHAAGFALLMLLIIIVTYRDIAKFFN